MYTECLVEVRYVDVMVSAATIPYRDARQDTILCITNIQSMAISAPITTTLEDFDPTPAGNHVARVYQIVHIGTIPETYMGEEKEMNKVRISFELPNETHVFKEENGEQPYVISQEYTLSMGEKANLRKLVEGIIGQGFLEVDAQSFEVTELLGRACMLNVIHRKSKTSGRVYAQIASASPLPKGMEAPAPVNTPVILDYDNWNEEVFKALPDFLKDKIRSSREYKALKGEHNEPPVEAYAEEGTALNEEDLPY